jgi:hypothetical protein
VRTTNAGTDSVLALNTRFVADLYTFEFAEGTELWTSAETNITYSTTTWLATGPIIMRGSNRLTAGLEVDETTITLYPGSRTIGGRTIKAAAMGGSFDRIRVVVERAYMSSWGTVPGVVKVFDGQVVEVIPSATAVQVSVLSKLSRLLVPIPRRVFQPQCGYLVYDTDCGLAAASWKDATKTVAAGSTASVVNINSAAAYATPGAVLQVTNAGALLNLKRTIQSVSTTALTLSVPFPSAPSPTWTVEIYKACDKTRTACRAFSNIARFGGFPDIPLPKATGRA